MILEIFLMLLLICSTFTALGTEAVKKLLDEHKVKYYSNTLAGVVAVLMSILVAIAYIIMVGAILNSQVLVCIVALVILSWLSAMVGYDKVIQAIAQIKKG